MSESKPVRVAVCGALGKMGRETVRTILNAPDFLLVGVADISHTGQDVALAVGMADPCDIPVQNSVTGMLQNSRPEVCVDFTQPASVMNNAVTMIQHQCRPLVGTTGLSEGDLNKIRLDLEQAQLPGAVIPNFAIGAVLMMRFAKEASKYFDHGEIIEFHHNQKLDAPSGTATQTAVLMEEGRREGGGQLFGQTNVADKELMAGARGGKSPGNIHIHSVRLPGMVAHQEVILGAAGQVLSIRHDSLDRVSFMPGVVLAVRQLMTCSPGLVIGLENLLP